ncbi:hypothetical protein ACEQPO_12350 [Bacillus sp. SL00103]
MIKQLQRLPSIHRKREKTNKESLTVEGKATDDHLDQVTVNGKKATIKDGTYSQEYYLRTGKYDQSHSEDQREGNKTTKKINIDVNMRHLRFLS